MTKTLYEIGRAGLREFTRALAEVVEKDVTLTPDQAADVPLVLARAEWRLMQTWDEICCGSEKHPRPEPTSTCQCRGSEKHPRPKPTKVTSW